MGLGFKESTSCHQPNDCDLVVVDVGCRWGFADQFIQCLDNFRLYGFDPDKEECERLDKLYASDRIKLVPFGLADHIGSARLFLTKEPACSSLYEPDPQLTDNYSALDCARKTGETEIEVTTLDQWSDDSGVKYIDYIKIDTQGSELLVLNGARHALDNVRALNVEVEFNPIYQGQPLFADVDNFLRQQGFVLWKLTNFVHYGLNGESSIEVGEDRIHYDQNSQIIQKHGGQLFWADAHYVRAEIAQSIYATKQQMLRDITLFKCLNHLDLVRRIETTASFN